MQYLFLIYDDESVWESLSEAEQAHTSRGFGAFANEAREADALVWCDKLAPTRNARTLRPGSQDLLVHDGPYAEAREVLAGLFILECPNLDEAMTWARRIPLMPQQAVEARSVMAA